MDGYGDPVATRDREPAMFQTRMMVEEVSCPDCGRRFRFTPPLPLTRQEEVSDLWLYDDGVLDFVACGATDEEVAAALGDDVCYAYTHFAERDPRLFSPEARGFRAMVLARVTPFGAPSQGDAACETLGQAGRGGQLLTRDVGPRAPRSHGDERCVPRTARGAPLQEAS
jgi:hypothetical protein